MLVIYLPTFSKTQELQIEIASVLQRLSLKRQTKIAADDTLIFYFYFLKKIRVDVSCESST